MLHIWRLWTSAGGPDGSPNGRAARGVSDGRFLPSMQCKLCTCGRCEQMPALPVYTHPVPVFLKPIYRWHSAAPVWTAATLPQMFHALSVALPNWSARAGQIFSYQMISCWHACLLIVDEKISFSPFLITNCSPRSHNCLSLFGVVVISGGLNYYQKCKYRRLQKCEFYCGHP